MIKLNNELKKDYTEILHERDYNIAPYNFIVNNKISDTLAIINFQDGSVDKKGVNGVLDEDLILMIIKRIECIQKTKYRCSENDLALLKLEEALIALKHIANKIYF